MTQDQAADVGSRRQLSAAGANRGNGSNRTNAGRNSNAGRKTGTHAVVFCHCFSVFIFSLSYSSSFPNISFLTSTITGGAQQESAGRPDGANGYVFFCFFVFSTLLFYSYHSFTFYFVAKYSNRRDGVEQDGTGQAATAMRVGRGQGGGKRR